MSSARAFRGSKGKKKDAPFISRLILSVVCNTPAMVRMGLGLVRWSAPVVGGIHGRLLVELLLKSNVILFTQSRL